MQDTYTLDGDMMAGPGTCIRVLAGDGAIIDCKGYSITGSGSGTGLSLEGASKVTVRNCTISNFEYGIWIGGDNNTLTNNSLTRNRRFGVSVHGSRNIVSGNTISSNLNSGIELWGDYNLIENNTIASNTNIGIDFIDGSGSNVISYNSITGNEKGIYLIDRTANWPETTANAFERNSISNGRYGVYFVNVTGNYLRENDARFNTASDYYCETGSINTDGGTNYCISTNCGWMHCQ